MWQWHRCICCLIFTLITSFMAVGQSSLSLPKLLPSYSEDFSQYKTFPSMCISNAFKDKNGKLWLRTCSGANVTNALHLFQFDGYEFKLVEDPFSQLPGNPDIRGLYKEKELIGILRNDTVNQLFFFDLDTEQLRFQNFENKGSIISLTITEDNKIFILFEKEELWSFYEWIDGQLIEQTQVENLYPRPENDGLLWSIHHSEEAFWMRPERKPELIYIDKKAGTLKKYTPSDFLDDLEVPDNRRIPNMQFLESNMFYTTNSLSTNHKIYQLDLTTDRFIPLDGIPIGWESQNIFKDEKGNLVFLFKNETGTYRAILEDINGTRYDYSAFFESLNGTTVSQLVGEDFKKEVIICNQKGILLQTVKASEAIQNFLPGVSTRAMVEISEDQFLISTQTADYYFLNKKTGTVSKRPIPGCIFGWTNFVPDAAGNIWSHANNNIERYNPLTKTCEKYPCETGNIRLFTFIGKDKLVLVDNKERLYSYDLITQKTEPFLIEGHILQFPGHTSDILHANNGWLWAATTNGLWKVDLEKKTAENFSSKKAFGRSRFMCIHEDEKERLWFGTALGGVLIYDPDSGTIKWLNSEQGLANNTVVSILADDEGIRWVGTYNGISLVSPEGDLITNIYPEDGLADRENNRYAYMKAQDGKLLIGTVNGLNIIDPKKIKERLALKKDLQIYLTTLEYPDPKSGKPIVQRYGLNDIGTIHLPASRHFLNLSFALSNYYKPMENQYAYRLEGLNENWIYMGNQHNLSLNSLPSGKYNLLIKGSDGTGNWIAQPLAISIEAKAVFYKQAWFYLFCLLLVGSLSFLWIYYLRKEIKKATKRIRKDKEIIELQAGKLLELDEAKSRFFTNISHEFRTPLTIISGMIDQIKNKPEQWLGKGSQMIKQNTVNLLNLVNQILDLRKIESKAMKLDLVNGDIIQYLRYIIDSYQSYAQSKEIQLHFLIHEDSVMMDYDPEKLLRIISNLLSNAVKYTPNGGHIYFHANQKIEKEAEFLQIRIQDTGVGIREDQLPYIFDRFYQADDSNTRKGEPAQLSYSGGGTGIGLALTNELVKLMEGKIHVESEVGKGTNFIIELPIKSEAPKMKDSENIPTDSAIMLSNPISPPHSDPQSEKEDNFLLFSHPPSSDLPSLLIVEDNPDVRQFLIACLQDSYQLQIARDGQEGIDKAIELVPDLIVSDVMMPEKDGFELCETLKRDERTSHIPIILLTAKADQDSKILGLEHGADAYLTKPFEEKELLVRLRKLLELRQKLQQRYNSFDPIKSPANPEDLFIQKVRKVVEENLEDSDFSIPQLCRLVGMSRSQLHKKIKALTNLSTSIYVRSIRLNKAKHLLENTEMNVSEVAYEVGFKDPNYFSRLFMEMFGYPPSKTRK